MSSLYTVTGYKTNKMNKVDTTETPFQILYDYQPTSIDIDETYTRDTIKPLKNTVDYFLAGELKDEIRSNENLLRKQLVVLDYDDLKKDEFIKFTYTIKEKLLGISFILYPTMSNYVPEMGMRFRLVIDTDRTYTIEENKILLQNVIDYIGIKCDSASATYSQLMGLPILNKLSKKEMIFKQLGEPLQVDSYLYEPVKKREFEPIEFTGELSHEVAVQMVQSYVDRVGSKLYDRSYYLNPYMNIKHAYQTGEIDLTTVEECLTILAMNNGEWAEDNIQHFKLDLSSPVKNGTPFTQFFGWVTQYKLDYSNIDEIGDSVQLLYGDSLKQELIERRKQELARMKAEWEADGGKGRPPSILSTLQCSLILKEYVIFCLFDSEENTRLAMYEPDKGTYTQNETHIRRVIGWLEPKHNAQRAAEVIYHIWKDSEIRQKTVSRYLIPVKNGVFNLKTKILEPFSPKYVFTSKIATAYIDNPELSEIDGWNIEKWFNDIACSDPQIARLLWEVISDSINGNYSRKKSIWLIGDGSNGKGTYQQLLHNLIGSENIATLKINQFGERFKLALLMEKVCCIGDDVGAGIYIDDSSEFNSVVTNETVLVEFKHKMASGVRLYPTIIQSTNDMPKIKNKTKGTYRRLLIVPFKANFEGASDNWKIKEDYIQRTGVLQYVLHKAVNMDFERFTVPDVSEELLKTYQQENDPVVDFKENVFDELVENLGFKRIPFYIVYGLYKEFCKENGFLPMSNFKFSKQFSMVLGDEWTSKKAKYIAGELARLDLPSDYNNYVYPPEVGKTYQQFVKSDLRLVQ